MSTILVVLLIVLAWLMVAAILYGLQRSTRRPRSSEPDVFMVQLRRLHEETLRRRKETQQRLAALRNTVSKSLGRTT